MVRKSRNGKRTEDTNRSHEYNPSPEVDRETSEPAVVKKSNVTRTPFSL